MSLAKAADASEQGASGDPEGSAGAGERVQLLHAATGVLYGDAAFIGHNRSCGRISGARTQQCKNDTSSIDIF